MSSYEPKNNNNDKRRKYTEKYTEIPHSD
jgi:hypothetical protein